MIPKVNPARNPPPITMLMIAHRKPMIPPNVPYPWYIRNPASRSAKDRTTPRTAATLIRAASVAVGSMILSRYRTRSDDGV